MNLIPVELRDQMMRNGQRSATDATHDPLPVVKLHVPGGGLVWLLTELDPDNPDLAYGLCDLGLGAPALDHVRLSAIERIAGGAVVHDADFVARQPISAYLREAQAVGAIRA